MRIFDTISMVKNMDINFDLRSIKEAVTKKKFYTRSLSLILGVCLLALNYNLFLAPNQFVIGGTSGLALIVQKLFSLEPEIFIGLSSVALVILSFIFLGWEETKRCIIGSIMYPIFISLTKPMATLLIPHFVFDSTLIVALLAGLFYGVSNGIIYKTGFNTGGSDVLMKIMSKYKKVPEGKAIFIVNLLIMLGGLMVFGVNKFVYSLIILYLSTVLIDRILIGISNSKLFLIYTKEEEKVKTFIMDELKSGVTIFDAKGGYSGEKNHVLMCVVPNKDYYLFKEMVLEIDQNAFFVINDCYEVSGGMNRRNLPFN